MSATSPTSVAALCDRLLEQLIERPFSVPRRAVGRLSRERLAEELALVQRRRAMEAAYEAELILALADETPDWFDPPPDAPGAKRAAGRRRPSCPG